LISLSWTLPCPGPTQASGPRCLWRSEGPLECFATAAAAWARLPICLCACAVRLFNAFAPFPPHPLRCAPLLELLAWEGGARRGSALQWAAAVTPHATPLWPPHSAGGTRQPPWTTHQGPSLRGPWHVSRVHITDAARGLLSSRWREWRQRAAAGPQDGPGGPRPHRHLALCARASRKRSIQHRPSRPPARFTRPFDVSMEIPITILLHTTLEQTEQATHSFREKRGPRVTVLPVMPAP
jgi:hypothetical protein